VAEAEALEGEFKFVLVARGEQEVAGFFFGVRVAAEEAAEVALEAVGEMVENSMKRRLREARKSWRSALWRKTR
jgi:hypothetical protein